MKFYGMFVVRECEAGCPEMVDCWDEYQMDGNPEGFNEQWSKVRADTDILGSAVVEFHLSEGDLMAMILPEHQVVATGMRKVED